MAPARFGASKFRNAVPHVPPREEWYRDALPPSSSSSATSSSTSTFSSEIKTSQKWVVTLSPSGELSYRGYDAVGSDSGSSAVKGLGGGGGVGDWDLSRLEGGVLAVGGLDGSISIQRLPTLSSAPGRPTPLHTVPPTSSPITNLLWHPTTPNLLLVSTIQKPLAIYDISSSPTSPVLELYTKEPKGFWAVDWSPDGKLLASVGRSGTGALWDPRAGKEAVMSRGLPIQAVKPARIAFVGDDIFLTSFSKTRNREYSLLSATNSLSTTFTQSLDTNPGVLIPIVDQERRIVYTAGRGDMTLRQIELSGSTGFQETLHALPYAVSSASLALTHPTNLPVMSAQIATVIVPVVDKDGDALLPFGIKVPRRQLIDYHDDLYPEIRGTIPEQSSQDWVNGNDAVPLLISLDPARRSAWEIAVSSNAQQLAPAPTSDTTTLPGNNVAPNASTEAVSQSQVPPPPPQAVSDTVEEGHDMPSPDLSVNLPSAKPVSKDNLPPLEPGEDYTSTTYKAGIMGHHIAEQLETHRKDGNQSPLMVGLQGPQGCGKTTLCETLVKVLEAEPRKLRSSVLSLDDLYRTNAGLKELAQKHPDNKLLTGRGPPGTHDVDLATSVLSAVRAMESEPAGVVELPIFDKSLHGGEGDRSSEMIKLEGPIDVFILEGWSVGFAPLSEDDLSKRYEEATQSSEKTYFSAHSLDSLSTLNSYQSEVSSRIYPFLSAIIQIEPTTYEYVFEWRLQQEHAMKAKNGGKGMTDEQVHYFVERYMPGYELWKEGIWSSDAPWAGRGLRLHYGRDREVTKVDKPIRSSQTNDPAEDNTAAKSSTAPPLPKPQLTSSGPSTPSRPTGMNRSTASIPSTPSKPYNPNWSRKFLGAKAPLIPSYDQVPPLATLHQDSLMLKCTPLLAFFPIQGPGGRLGVHQLKKKGRMPMGGEGYLSGGVELADFAVEMFGGSQGGRVALAGDDGVIRVWRLGEEGVQGAGPEPNVTLKGKGIDKIAQLAFHPTAQNLLTAATNDHGKACIRFWNLSSGEEVKATELETNGVFNMCWSPDGDRMAVATKDGHILVLDPRNPSSLVSGTAHDSPRSFQIAWTDSTHLITIGFSRGSQRKINLYSIESTSITSIHSLLIDISPSVLFPVYDPDTSILYVWGKGERQIQAYEVHPEHPNEPIAKLPSYTSGAPQLGVAFLPKGVVDVRKVEVMRVLRLTAKTMEEVTFSIPRNKPDFFQDDVYPDTIDVETPSCSAAEWLEGKDVPPRRISLKPEGMTSLSQAPQTTSVAKAKFVPAADIMSEEEKKRQEMDRLFQKAKADESSDEEVDKKGIDPPDDW